MSGLGYNLPYAFDSLTADGQLINKKEQKVKFYNKKVLAFKAKIDEHGQPIIDKKTGLPMQEAYEDIVEMCQVHNKNDLTIIDDKSDDLKRSQFYQEYRLFKDGKILDGLPIEESGFMQPGTITELKIRGIHVVEQLAEMPDHECSQLRNEPGFILRDMAKQWVKINSPVGQSAKVAELEAELLKMKERLAQLDNSGPITQAITSNEKQYVETSSDKRGRGRPRKV